MLKSTSVLLQSLAWQPNEPRLRNRNAESSYTYHTTQMILHLVPSNNYGVNTCYIQLDSLHSIMLKMIVMRGSPLTVSPSPTAELQTSVICSLYVRFRSTLGRMYRHSLARYLGPFIFKRAGQPSADCLLAEK